MLPKINRLVDLDLRTNLTSASLGFPVLSIGSIWRKIPNLLPGIPDFQDHISLNSSPHSSFNSQEFLSKVKEWMPNTVWVQDDMTGELKIPEDFWHALKQLIEEDDNILSLKNSDISEDHWRAIKSRIETNEGFNSGIPVDDIDAYVKKATAQSWDSWLAQNDQFIKKSSAGKTVTKDDFLKLLKQEVEAYQREIRHELTGLQKRTKTISEKLSKLQQETSQGSHMTKDEQMKHLDAMVSKAISRGELNAIAEGVVKGHASDVLANQVNFFSPAIGAAFDPVLSSPGWNRPKDVFKSPEYLSREGNNVQPGGTVLYPWTSEVECFCAGPDKRGYGQGTNNVSVLISRDIIPQHLVVEHILPGATLDPGAMPREIEVWAYFVEVNLRNELLAFSEMQFPDTPEEQVLNDGFVKIGHFTYENRTSGDGIQVFKLSSELTRLGATTNQVVVRALNNYGADHTCFYRLRLYGDSLGQTFDSPVPAEKPKLSWIPWR
ncbi:hypothetical protein F4777DRAFT_568469 [Nemania sp. FL0916]|nr:hypothetical protein F4777DRAFT_568469 [Nemania sp. FL0916]